MRVFLMTAAIVALFTMPIAATAQTDEPNYGAMARSMRMGGLKGKKLDKAVTAADAHPLGAKQNPVRVNGPLGQRGYLARLRCEDGQAPAFSRRGNAGNGVFGTIIDVYEVNCPAAAPIEVYMDMYHGTHVETRAVPGFTLTAPADQGIKS